jgi:low affinity Fe/Cu permease
MRIARIQAEIQISLYCITPWRIENFGARSFEMACEARSKIGNHIQMDELKEQKTERSFFCTVQDAFRVFARKSSAVLGTAWSFAIAIVIIVVWGITGPMFHFSDTWQLIINTGTTIVTFLMVFLIQNTQNRDAKAVHLKLDELIRALEGARNKLVDLEGLSDEELVKLENEFQRLRKISRDDDTHAAKIEAAL